MHEYKQKGDNRISGNVRKLSQFREPIIFLKNDSNFICKRSPLDPGIELIYIRASSIAFTWSINRRPLLFNFVIICIINERYVFMNANLGGKLAFLISAFILLICCESIWKFIDKHRKLFKFVSKKHHSFQSCPSSNDNNIWW